jgi:hypothetical protein
VYQSDPTQGQACALACGAGIVFCNYFACVEQAGQAWNRQIYNLAGVEEELDNGTHNYFPINNGYSESSQESLACLGERLSNMTAEEVDRLTEGVRFGLHKDVEVRVYSGCISNRDWAPLAKLVCYFLFRKG